MFYHRLQNTVSLHHQFRYMAYSGLQVPVGTNSSFLRKQFLRQSIAAVVMSISAGTTVILNTRVCVQDTIS